MLFSVNWLKKWVDIDLPVDELSGKLTASGLEVDTVEPVAAPFSGVVVAEITSCEQHPDADKLKLCSIDFGGNEPAQVVCGAPNARAGIKIPLATVGAVLGEDFKIRKAKLRGIESNGMVLMAENAEGKLTFISPEDEFDQGSKVSVQLTVTSIQYFDF